MGTSDDEPLRIQSPCPLSWSALTPGETEGTRACSQCNREVFDASAVSAKEARAYIEEQGGHACISLVTLPDGRNQHSLPSAPKGFRQALLAASAALAAACGPGDAGEPAVPPVESTGRSLPEPGPRYPDCTPSRLDTRLLYDPNLRALATAAIRVDHGQDYEPTHHEIVERIEQLCAAEHLDSQMRLMGYF